MRCHGSCEFFFCRGLSPRNEACHKPQTLSSRLGGHHAGPSRISVPAGARRALGHAGATPRSRCGGSSSAGAIAPIGRPETTRGGQTEKGTAPSGGGELRRPSRRRCCWGGCCGGLSQRAPSDGRGAGRCGSHRAWCNRDSRVPGASVRCGGPSPGIGARGRSGGQVLSRAGIDGMGRRGQPGKGADAQQCPSVGSLDES